MRRILTATAPKHAPCPHGHGGVLLTHLTIWRKMRDTGCYTTRVKHEHMVGIVLPVIRAFMWFICWSYPLEVCNLYSDYRRFDPVPVKYPLRIWMNRLVSNHKEASGYSLGVYITCISKGGLNRCQIILWRVNVIINSVIQFTNFVCYQKNNSNFVIAARLWNCGWSKTHIEVCSLKVAIVLL